jgi:hypothetical protein
MPPITASVVGSVRANCVRGLRVEQCRIQDSASESSYGDGKILRRNREMEGLSATRASVGASDKL